MNYFDFGELATQTQAETQETYYTSTMGTLRGDVCQMLLYVFDGANYAGNGNMKSPWGI
jgi:hypothetical protein